jgi:hypothetical protein
MSRFVRLVCAVIASAGAIAACGNEPAPSASPPEPAARDANGVAALRQQFRRTEAFLLAGASARLIPADAEHVRVELSRSSVVSLELPLRSSGSVRLRERKSGVTLAFTPVTEGDGPLATADGIATYRSGSRELPSLAYRITNDGVEDYVVVDDAATHAVRYLLGFEGVAGLRLVANVLELVDASGTPRLHVAAARVVDRAGKTVVPRVELGADCARDADPRAPWGRPVVPPGRSSCVLTVSWDPSGLAYPVALDPSWTQTGSLASGHVYHTATRLQDGRVLVAAGSPAVADAELYDPATGTFAVTGTLVNGRRYHRASLLNDGRVLVTGNWIGPSTAAEIYDPASGTWALTGSMANGRYSHTQTTLSSGKVLVAGGQTAAAELYDPATAQFSPAGNTVGSRYDGVAIQLAGGKVLLAGGYVTAVDERTCELFDPSTKTWSLTGSLIQPRDEAYGVLLLDGRVLFAGGYGPIIGGGAYEYLTLAEIYDPATATWSATGGMSFGRSEHTLTLLASGAVLAYGGFDSYDGFPYTELFDPNAGGWTVLPDAPFARFAHTANALADHSVLVSGGSDTGLPELSSYLFKLQAPGTACSLGVECDTGHCADGVCCDTACSGACRSCLAAKKGSGQDGTCGNIVAGSDPDDECPALVPSTCGTSGACNGAGACALYASGTACGPPSCSSGTLTSGACNGSGACVQTQTSCAPYTCADATSCFTVCNDSGQCASGAFCDVTTHTCKSAAANGTACQAGSQCKSGFCVEGVCCDSACSGICQSCAAATNGGQDGTCAFAVAGSDPGDDCPDEGAASCQKDGTCDGAGACRTYPAGTACGPTQCVKGAQVGSSCNGTGACVAGTNVACAPYACVSGACKTSCSSDDDCDAAGYCSAGSCGARKDKGSACTAKDECVTNLCVDGVCCNAPCAGQCEACNTTGAPGTCLPVEGDPVGGRPACPQGSELCQQKKCNGTDRLSCEAFAGADVVCQAASCSQALEHAETTCDGAGSCPAPDPKPCNPYVCGATSCKTSCAADSDCAVGAKCEMTSGKCVSSGTCSDDHTLVIAGEAPIDCSPYSCSDGTCRAGCTSVADCVGGNVCSTAGACVPASASPSDQSSGCSCRLGSKRTPYGSFWLLLLALGFGWRRARPRRADAR